MYRESFSSETDGEFETGRLIAMRPLIGWNERRFCHRIRIRHLIGEIWGYIKIAELGVDKRIHEGEGIDGDGGHNREVAVAMIRVLLLLKGGLPLRWSSHIIDGVTRRDNGYIRFRRRIDELPILEIGVEIVIRLLIILIATIHSGNGIGTAHERAIDDRKFPITAIINLAIAGNDGAHPNGTKGVDRAGFLVGVMVGLLLMGMHPLLLPVRGSGWLLSEGERDAQKDKG